MRKLALLRRSLSVLLDATREMIRISRGVKIYPSNWKPSCSNGRVLIKDSKRIGCLIDWPEFRYTRLAA